MPDYTPDPALVALVAKAIREAPVSIRNGYVDSSDVYSAEARAVLSALAAEGRLQDDDAVTEWGWLSADTVRVYASLSEAAARRAASRSGARKTMRREVGPWLPAPEETP